MDVKLFISAASVEFEDYREPLRDALTRPNVSVKIQEDFKANGETTLVKLDDYIRICDAVIHLAGDACGGDAPATCVRALAARYPDLATKLPNLATHVGDGAAPLSYTQWEAWIALYHGKGLYIAAPLATAPRGGRHVRDEAEVARQQGHLDILRRDHHRHAQIRFRNVDHLSSALLASSILELMSRAEVATRLAGDASAAAEFATQQKHSRLPAPLFQHLWRQLGNRPDLLGRLASAARAGSIEPLAAALPGTPGDLSDAANLRSAWLRVTWAKAWEPRARALHLPLVRWQELAAIVALNDAREPPPFYGLHELLLWATDSDDLERDQAAMTQLLWLAAEAARQEPAAPMRRAARLLLDAIEASADLQPHLAQARTGPPPPVGPVRLHVELALAQDKPKLMRYWVQEHPGRLTPATDLPPGTCLGEQLKAIADAIPRQRGRGLHVELMAPLQLLSGQPAWTTYGELSRDFCDDRPVVWRWRDRLENDPNANPQDWHEWAGRVVDQAGQCAHLVCRFADEAADDETAYLVVLPYVPPAPGSERARLKAFRDAMLWGHPYMLWPADESVVEAFQAEVRDCVADKHATDLPEALHRARKSGAMRHTVLFIDEPDGNPYELAGGLSTTGDLSIIT